MTVQNAISEFLLASEADGHQATTLGWYRSLLGAFAEAHSGALVNQITTAQLRAYIVNLRQSEYAEDTVSAHLRALHKFFSWSANEYTFPNPMRNIKYPKAKQPQPRAAALEDIRRMFEAAGRSTSPKRDKAIIAFLVDTGCRAAGLCGLTIADLDLVERRAMITEKGSKTRAVVFTDYTGNLLLEWINARQPVPTVFYNLDTLEPLRPNGLYQLLRRLARRAGVEGRFHPHSLRHTFAREYIRAGGNLATLSKIMGHRDVSTTVNHYVIYTDKDIQEAHERYSPINLIRVKRCERCGQALTPDGRCSNPDCLNH